MDFSPKYHMDFQGLKIAVENPKNSIRHWKDKENHIQGDTKMLYPYGYIEGTLGADGDEVDVFIGPNKNSDKVFIVHQKKLPDFKKYDEDKVLLGWNDLNQALKAYKKHYFSDLFVGSITKMNMDEFKKKVFKVKGKPIMKADTKKEEYNKIPGGLAEGKLPEDFDREQLDAGTRVELEHTKDVLIAREIAMDHLTEDKDYYKKLKKMEAPVKKSLDVLNAYLNE